MLEVTKVYETETGHRLSNYDGKCSHLHGHSYRWEVTATSEGLDNCGMVVDFKDLKGAMVAVLEPFDHAMVLWREDPLFVEFGDKLFEMLRATNGHAPRLCYWPVNPTAENFAAYAAQAIQKALDYRAGGGVTVTRVRVWETSNSFAEWTV